MGVLGTVTDAAGPEGFFPFRFNGAIGCLGRLCLLRTIGELGALRGADSAGAPRSAGPLIFGILQLVGGEVKSKYKLPVLLGETVPGS